MVGDSRQFLKPLPPTASAHSLSFWVLCTELLKAQKGARKFALTTRHAHIRQLCQLQPPAGSKGSKGSGASGEATLDKEKRGAMALMLEDSRLALTASVGQVRCRTGVWWAM